MALKTKSSSQGVYLKIFGGKIVRESSQPWETDEKLLSRETKEGKKVYYTQYDSISGKITRANIKTIEAFNIDMLELDLVDVVERYSLSFPADGRFGKSFMTRMLNIDLASEVEIVPYSFEDKEGKRVSGLNIFQNGKKLDPSYTREKPNGLPEAKQVRKGKETKWDFTDQLNFLYDQFDKFKDIIPKPLEPTEQKVVSFADDAADNEFDDLPF